MKLGRRIGRRNTRISCLIRSQHQLNESHKIYKHPLLSWRPWKASLNYVTHTIQVPVTWAHRRGNTPKIESIDGSTAVLSTILVSPEDDQCWSKRVVCIHQ
jgi:hypothetical protein